MKLFPKDRIFASDKQIEQASEMFLDSWAIVKAHEGKKIICHFGVSTKKKKVSVIDPLLQREHPSQKDLLQFPFKIMFSHHQGKMAYLKKPGIFVMPKSLQLSLSLNMLVVFQHVNHPSEDCWAP